MTELWKKSAVELAREIKAGTVSSREVIDAHLQRIEAVNPHLNAIVRLLADEARAGADEADRRRASGEPLGPLHGVPITVKENIDLAGTPTTNGVPFFAEAVASVDAVIVERMRRAGAIPIGRTNLPDFGLRIHTDSALHGLTRNPWHPDRTTGGSSGGEGSALASGMSPLGLGNDIGGSVRNPAHCCGVASIKPTTGRVPGTTVIDPVDGGIASQLMLSDGPMARTVADVSLALSIISGPHPRDPLTVPVPMAIGPTSKLRVAVMAEPPGSTVDPAIAAAVRHAGGALADAGHQVVEATPPEFEAVFDTWADLLVGDNAPLTDLITMVMGEGGRAFLTGANSTRPETTLASFVATMTRRRMLMRAWADWYERFDVLLCPVWTEAPFLHDADIAAPFETLLQARAVMPANLFGLPAAVVPAGVHDGLPIGVQLVSWQFHDRTALAAAADIEAALGIITPIEPILHA